MACISRIVAVAGGVLVVIMAYGAEGGGTEVDGANVFGRLEEVRKVQIGRPDRCIRCGACVVQCPKDALFFENAGGSRVEAETIRRFKLNLLGKRAVTPKG